MKYLKTYKDLSKPQIGDYVILTSKITEDEELMDFLSKNIGKYIRNDYQVDSLPYLIKFTGKMSPKLSGTRFNGKNYRRVSREDIIFFSPNKEDCETYLTAKKYNL